MVPDTFFSHGSRKFFDAHSRARRGITRAKHVLSYVEGTPRTPSSELISLTFAPLREIFRVLVAALPR